jgi:uncharacterized LabA/DUF88 family protein
MKRHAIFVDAGYVFAQGSVSLIGRNSKRTELKLDEAEIIKQLKFLALSESPGVELLRVYWYDGARNGPTIDHLAIANMQDVKLRLGSINNVGEQKEVDSLLVTDLIDLARNQSICNATVIAGDSDVRIAVQIAQSFGVRVHLVGLEPSRISQSPLLRQEADTVHEISKADVARFLKVLTQTPPIVVPDPASPIVAATLTQVELAATPETGAQNAAVENTHVQTFEEAVRRTLATAGNEDIQRLSTVLSTSSGVPQEYDGRLLGISRTLLTRDLTGDERRELRSIFRREVLRPGRA